MKQSIAHALWVSLLLVPLLPAGAAAQNLAAAAEALDAPPPPAPGAADGLPDIPPPPPDARPPRGYDAVGGFPRSSRAALLRAETRDLHIPSHVATRLRVLDGDLTALAARGGGNVVDGALSMVAGAISLTIGIVLRDDPVAPFLYLVGGAAIARGVLTVALLPNPQGPAVTFAHMPMTTDTEVAARLVYGESALERLADRNRLARLLDAGLNMGVAVAVVPFVLGPNEFAFDDPGDYFIVIAAGISLLSGVVTLVSQTEAERRWESYRALRDRLVREQGRPTSEDRPRRPTFGAGPVRGGAAGSMSWQF